MSWLTTLEFCFSQITHWIDLSAAFFWELHFFELNVTNDQNSYVVTDVSKIGVICKKTKGIDRML
jgi:hypothetical protein